MMFIVNKLDVNHWKQIAMHTKEDLNEDQLQFISKYSEEQFAIILYIEELYLENLKSVDPLLYSKLTHQ